MKIDYIIKTDYIIFGVLIISILLSIYLIWSQRNEHFADKKHHHHHKLKQEVKTEIKQENKNIKQEVKQEIKQENKNIKQEAKQEVQPELPQEFLQPLPPILTEAELQQLYQESSPETFPELHQIQQELRQEINPEILQENKINLNNTNFDDSISVYEDDNIIILKKDRLRGVGNLINPNNEDIVTYDPYKCMKGDMEPFASVKKPRQINSVCSNKSLAKRYNIEGVNNLNHMQTQAEIQKLKFSLDDPAAYYRDHFKYLRPELDFYYKGSNMPDYTKYANINEIGRIPLEKSKDSKYPLPANFTFKNSPSFE